jgi:hypothetical protein
MLEPAPSCWAIWSAVGSAKARIISHTVRVEPYFVRSGPYRGWANYVCLCALGRAYQAIEAQPVLLDHSARQPPQHHRTHVQIE